MATPAGWAQDSGNPDKYNATLNIPRRQGNALVNNSQPEEFKVQVDNTTGSISITRSSDNVNFYNYDPSLNKWSVPSGSVNSYTEALKNIGLDGLNSLTYTSKLGAVKVINGTSDAVDRDKIKDSSGYTGSLNNSSEDEDEKTTAPVEPLTPINTGIIGSQRTYENLMYPSQRSDTPEDQDTIQFKQYTYGKRDAAKSGSIFALTSRQLDPVEGSVTLSIPTGIRDSNRVNWTPIESNPFELGAAVASKEMMDDFAKGATKAVQNAITQIQDPKNQDAIKTFLAAQASGLNNALARFNGAILNPNTELLFGGPGLRDFAYTIEMAPRSNEEAREIRKIIRFFKEGMAVRRTTGNLYLQAPNVFSIRYLYNNKDDHPYINLVKKQCALRDCSIDYTPQNTYMTHSEDGSMIAYRMTLQFTELEPVYFDDYVGSGDGETSALSEDSMGY